MSEGKRRIPLSSPSIHEEEIEAVSRVLRSRALVQGTEVAALEQSLCELTGAKEAIAVANGTVALELALRALDIGPGDEVIVPAFSFMATANAVEQCGAKPVFVDIDPGSFNIDPALVGKALGPHTRALLPVHEFGLCCDMPRLLALAQDAGVHVIEDAACAIGATLGGRHAGTMGRLGTLSLHPRKLITSGEGGVILCPDKPTGDLLRTLRNHGIEPGSTPPRFTQAGTNARLTDIQAALARPQLRRLPQALARRSAIATRYQQEITLSGAVLPCVPASTCPNWQTFHLMLPSRLERTRVIAHLSAQGIGANMGAQCMPAQPFYMHKYALDAERLFPHAWRAWNQGLAIPMHEELSDDDVTWIIQTLNSLT